MGTLKSLVDDDVEILNKIESEDFKFNEKNLLKVIKEYNLRRYSGVSSDSYKSLASVSFYCRSSNKVKETLRIKVNDSLEYKLPESLYPLPLRLPLEVPSKVCVFWEDGSACRLIMPDLLGILYYEVDRLTSDKSFEFKKRSFAEFKNYITFNRKLN